MDARALFSNAGKVPDLRTEERLRLLIDTGLLLSAERNLDVIVQAALDAGLALCGAAVGAIFYSSLGPDGEPCQLQKTAVRPGSGLDREFFATLSGPPSATGVGFGDSWLVPVRSGDMDRDARLLKGGPLAGLSLGPAPMRSLLALPVTSRTGELLGVLCYGHPEPEALPEDTEALVATVAAQTAGALESIRLTESLSREIGLADAARADQRASDLRLRQALQAAQLGTWSWERATGLLDFDERGAELFGTEPHVPIDRSLLRNHRIKPEDLQYAPEDLVKAVEGGGLYAAEYRIDLPDGIHRWIASSGMGMTNPATGEITGIVGTLQDITQRKVQEQSLRQSEKLAATGRLAATIAHEINNPLEAVTNLIYLAKTDAATPPPVQRMLETADAELARVAQIAQQTLGFYRDTTRPVEIDLNELIQAVVDLFGRKLAGHRLKCTLDLDPDLTIVGLQGEIRQVVSNLLVNAIDASSKDGGDIRIRARKRHRNGDKGICVLVSDCGSGIPRDVRQRLFTPFVTTKQSLGTGLGLWVTRGMVEKHGGTVSFRSRTEEPSGTVFKIYLPQSGASPIFAPQSSAVLQ